MAHKSFTSPRYAWLLLLLTVLGVSCGDPHVKKQRHLERGDQYAAAKQDDFAVIEYANAVRLDPKFGEARYKLAQTLERMDNPRQAFPEFIRAADALPDNREVQLKATQVLLLVGRFEDAKARAATLLVKNPKDVDALLLRASAMAALKDPRGAIAEIEQALKVDPSDSRAMAGLATIRMRSGEAREAESGFKQAIALDPSSPDAHLAFANFLWTAGRTDEAEQSIKRALSIDAQHLLANRMLGILYIATGRREQAEHPLKTVAEISKAPEARLQLADYYLGARRVDEAKRLLTELAGQQMSFAEAELKLASIDYDTNGTEAHQRLDRLLARAPKYAPALVLKAQWLNREDKLDEALAHATAAVAADPASASAHYVLATVHDRRRETPEAMKAYNEVLRLNPRAAAAQVALSRLSLAAGNRDAAVRHAEEAKQTEPANAAARVALARSLLARGDLVRAEAEVSALATSLPNSAVVHTMQGTLHARRGNADAARRSYERARELAPRDIDAIAGLVALDIKSKQIAGAVARVEAELVSQPDRPELLALAADVYNVAGQPARAEQALKRSVAADPRFVQGYALLASHYVRQQRLDEARAEFEAIVTRNPAATGSRTMVGMILETQGKREEAKRWYEATVRATGDAPVAANNLAMIYAEEGTNLDIALQLATTAKQGLPDNPYVDDTLGWIYYKKNLPALAIGPLQESLKKLPDNPEVVYHLGLTYAKMGDKAKARAMLTHALELNPNFAGNDIARNTLSSITQ